MGPSFVNSFPQAPLNRQSTFRHVGKGLWLGQGRLPVWGSGGDCGCSVLGEWWKGQCTAVFEQRRRWKAPPTFHRLESLVGALQALPLRSLMAEQLLWLCQTFWTLCASIKILNYLSNLPFNKFVLKCLDWRKITNGTYNTNQKTTFWNSDFRVLVECGWGWLETQESVYY